MMNDNEYQKLAVRTCVAPEELFLTPEQRDLLHGVLGLQDEIGELANQLKKSFIYGKKLDETNIQEELGDALWFIAMIHEKLGLNMSDTKEKNIAKLRVRYPEKFTLNNFENRNLSEERNVLEGGNNG